jgi:hypothetical protein
VGVGASLDPVALCDLLVEERVKPTFASATWVDLSHGEEFGKRDRLRPGAPLDEPLSQTLRVSVGRKEFEAIAWHPGATVLGRSPIGGREIRLLVPPVLQAFEALGSRTLLEQGRNVCLSL